MFKSKLLHKTIIYDNELSPLLMQNPYSKFILAIKTLILTDFQNNCRSCCNKLRYRCCIYFPCLPAVKSFRKSSLSEVSFYTLDNGYSSESPHGIPITLYLSLEQKYKISHFFSRKVVTVAIFTHYYLSNLI